MRLMYLLLLGLSTLIVGCGKWLPIVDRTHAPESTLPTPRVSPDAVGVDVVFLRLPMVQESDLEEAWQSVNEQSLDIKLRRCLDANGIRAGIVAGSLPNVLQKWIDDNESRLKNDFLEQANIAADVASDTRRLICRAGKRKEIVIRPEKPGSIVLMHNDGQAKGKTYDQASLVLDLKMFPKPDGTAELKLMPEVQHGPMQPAYVGQDFAWRREMRKASDTWPEAVIQCQLAPGNILMVTSTQDPRGLGESFFWTETLDGHRQRIVLLIRLSSTQLDNLFLPERTEAAKRASESP